MSVEIVQVDAFTAEPFGGNPAGVCVLDVPGDDGWMQSVASEMNLAETAFLVPVHGGWDLRWFTPAVEVDLCGHATLAAAHHLVERGDVTGEAEVMRFFTASGELLAKQTLDGWIQIDLPATPPEPVTPPGALLASLGLSDAVAVSKSRLDYLIEVPSAELLRELQPNFTNLAAIGTRGVMVTSVGEGLYDMVSRFFAPSVGVDEDPVTGSAHCALGPYWADKLGKADLLAYQASKRGGVLRVSVKDDRVVLGGQAVTVIRATLEKVAAAPVEHVPS
ncbi:MAG: PhzF family phenazine biosynthesis protein [Actinobacteria bacterium]|nr:PhzF family phenazine biosynthesis protein [Actinomycetota bacterium]